MTDRLKAMRPQLKNFISDIRYHQPQNYIQVSASHPPELFGQLSLPYILPEAIAVKPATASL